MTVRAPTARPLSGEFPELHSSGFIEDGHYLQMPVRSMIHAPSNLEFPVVNFDLIVFFSHIFPILLISNR